jgi:hypothetical protein
LPAAQEWSDLYRFRRPALGLDEVANDAARAVVFPGGRNPPTANAFYFNGGEAGSNERLLEFDADAFAFAPGDVHARFGLAAARVFGTGGDFTRRGEDTANDPLLSPFKPVFDAHGIMTIGNNPYVTQRFPVVTLNPLAEPLPQLVLGDFLSYPAGGSTVDADGNLYLTDTNWSRLLIYRQPFRRFTAGAPLRCTSGTALERAKVVVRRNLLPAGDEQLTLGAVLPLAALAPVIDVAASGLALAFGASGSPQPACTFGKGADTLSCH